jgi:hypothetical protein
MLKYFKKEDNNNEKINNMIEFKLPIVYLEDKYRISENIKNDLELLDICNNSLYNNIISSTENTSTKLVNQWGEYYTTNKEFLKDYQLFLKNYKPISDRDNFNIKNIEEIINEIDNETGFYEKYKFIDIDYFKYLNKSSSVLQILTIYNLTSPVLSLIIPIIMLIMPFLIIKIQGLSISFEIYVSTMIKLFKNHILGQLFSKFSEADISQKFFLLFSFGFYIFSIYQNIHSCITFYKNIYKIQNNLCNINNFIEVAINNIDNLNKYCNKSFSKFLDVNNSIKLQLVSFRSELEKIQLSKLRITHIAKIGNILKSFYELYNNLKYKEALKYCIDLEYYLLNIKNIQNNIVNKNLNFCKFTDDKTNFSGAYFAALINKKHINNTYKLDKQILITGPNAAGKTTILKTTLFNIILSQQIGIGCYKDANINIYKYIYSYINIPDTSQRDSLFQAEARRCKEILDSLSNSNTIDRHFCIFDEIYSGTNPSEAIASAYSFLNFIAKYKNLDYILTTHYVSLCKLLDKNKNIINKQMKILNNNSTYKLKNGISDIKGGIKVLKELDYDETIIKGANEIIDKINI